MFVVDKSVTPEMHAVSGSIAVQMNEEVGQLVREGKTFSARLRPLVRSIPKKNPERQQRGSYSIAPLINILTSRSKTLEVVALTINLPFLIS
jgi:hypothetical protein